MKKISTWVKSGIATAMLLTAVGSASAAYPKIGSFDGEYGFRANSFEFNEAYTHYKTTTSDDITDYSLYFKADFNFKLQTQGSQVIVFDFPYPGVIRGSYINPVQGIPADYDQTTGELTLTVVTYQPDPIGVFFGLAPGGVWTGLSSLSSTKLKFQIGEDGSINIPDFEIIRYNGNNKGETVASYANIEVGDPQSGEDGPDPDKGDPSDGNDYSYMAGLWTFPELYSFASQGLVRNDEKEPPTYEANVTGSTIYFGDQGSGFNMVGWIIDATTIRFRFRAVGNPAMYTYYQCPFVNDEITQSNYNTAPLNKNVTFDATYDADTRTISFPDGTGLRFGAFNSVGKLANNVYEEVFRFDGPATWSPFVPSIDLYVDVENGKRISASENEEGVITITSPIRFYHFENGIQLTYKATVIDHYQDNDLEEDWDESQTVDATVANGTVTAQVTGYARGNHDFSFIVTAYDAAGQVYAVSNQRDFTFIVTHDTKDNGKEPDNAVDNIIDDLGAARYFNLQGIEVETPVKGNIYIKVTNGKSSKVIVK